MSNKKYYEVNEQTGEVTVAKNVVQLKEGDRVLRSTSLQFLNEKKKREVDKTDFVWVMFKYNECYLDISPANITRLLYLVTFCSFDGYAMKNNDIGTFLGINANQLKLFRDELFSKQILRNHDGSIYANTNLFGKGKIDTPSLDYTRLFTNALRQLYDSCDTTTKHKHLSYIFKMMPFVNRQTNILSHNQCEQDETKIDYMTIQEFCNIVGYDDRYASRLRKDLSKFRLFGELVIGFFDTTEKLKSDGKYIVVNPKLFYGGVRKERSHKKICSLFEEEKRFGKCQKVQ